MPKGLSKLALMTIDAPLSHELFHFHCLPNVDRFFSFFFPFFQFGDVVGVAIHP